MKVSDFFIIHFSVANGVSLPNRTHVGVKEPIKVQFKLPFYQLRFHTITVTSEKTDPCEIRSLIPNIKT